MKRPDLDGADLSHDDGRMSLAEYVSLFRGAKPGAMIGRDLSAWCE
jgi:hypothetical protein